MEPAQIIALLAGSTVLGGVITKTLDWIRDARAGQLQARRAEVDRALQDRDKAIEQREAAIEAEDAQARLTRRVEESLAIHRHIIIDAPCLGPTALPPYPSRKD